MKTKIVISALLCICCFVFLTGCDPKYPPDKLKVEKIETLSQGSSVDIKIIYPNTGGSIVLGWKDENMEIVDGNEFVSISGLSITGLKPGTARIKVNATTVISDEAAAAGNKDKVYSVEIEIKVE